MQGTGEESKVGRKNSEAVARHVDTREAARMLGIGQREVRELAARGRLQMKTEGVAARLMVSESSVRKLRSELEQAR